jgi:hypothetical protein
MGFFEDKLEEGNKLKSYSSMVTRVGLRAHEQYYSSKELDVKKALEGIKPDDRPLNYREMLTLEDFAERTYKGFKKEAEEHERFCMMTGPFRMHGLALSAVTGYLMGDMIASELTRNAYFSFLTGFVTEGVALGLEMAYRPIAGTFAGVRGRSPGDGFDHQSLFEKTVYRLAGSVKE